MTNFQVNDRVVVAREGLATWNHTGLVTNINEETGLVSVLLDSGSVQYRNEYITRIVKYHPDSLELLDRPEEYDWTNEYHGPVVIVWKNQNKPCLANAELVMYMFCASKDDCKQMAAKEIEKDPEAYYWVSMTNPSMVELHQPEPTIRKVNEE